MAADVKTLVPDLDELFRSPEYERDGYLRAVSARRVDVFSIDLTFEATIGGEVHQSWLVDASNVHASIVSVFGGSKKLELLQRHVLLLPHVDHSAELGFQGHTNSMEAVVGELWMAHVDVVGGYFPFNAFRQDCLDFPTLFANGSGVVARGPITMLDAYAAVLRKYDLRPSIVNRRRPHCPTHEEHRDETCALSLLLFSEHCWIIAEAFTFERLL